MKVLREQDSLDESDCYNDVTFASARGGEKNVPTGRGKGVQIMTIVDCHGLPLGVTTHTEKCREVTLG